MSEARVEKRPLWRQPLLHFLLAGAAIFALDGLRESADYADSDRIVVTVAQVERMAGLWHKTWGRPPSDAELQGLVRDHIKEEIYYREALKLGLDINDTVIRRRLRQKMEFLTADDTPPASADETTLQRYYERNADRYLRSPVFDFRQLYFAAANRADAERALQAIRDGADPQEFGEQISLPGAMADANQATIARTFGSAFYASLNQADTGEWVGPIESGFGQHLVRIDRKSAAHLPPLQEVRSIVETDWMAEQRIAAEDAAFQELRARYDVEIEVPDE